MDHGSQCKPVDEEGGKGEETPQNGIHKRKQRQNNFRETPTATDKIRSTPLSGSFLQTSRIEAAMLIQMFLSDLKSMSNFGCNTPYMLRKKHNQKTKKEKRKESKEQKL